MSIHRCASQQWSLCATQDHANHHVFIDDGVTKYDWRVLTVECLHNSRGRRSPQSLHPSFGHSRGPSYVRRPTAEGLDPQHRDAIHAIAWRVDDRPPTNDTDSCIQCSAVARRPKMLTAGTCRCGTFRAGEWEGCGAPPICRCGTFRAGETHGHGPNWGWRTGGVRCPSHLPASMMLCPWHLPVWNVPRWRTGGVRCPSHLPVWLLTPPARKAHTGLPVWNVPRWRS